MELQNGNLLLIYAQPNSARHIKNNTEITVKIWNHWLIQFMAPTTLYGLWVTVLCETCWCQIHQSMMSYVTGSVHASALWTNETSRGSAPTRRNPGPIGRSLTVTLKSSLWFPTALTLLSLWRGGQCDSPMICVHTVQCESCQLCVLCVCVLLDREHRSCWKEWGLRSSLHMLSFWFAPMQVKLIHDQWQIEFKKV